MEEDEKRKKVLRYFTSKSQEETNVEQIKQKRKSQQTFHGRVIRVQEGISKPLSVHILRQQHKRKHPVNQIIEQKEEKLKIPKKILKKYTHGERVESVGVKTEFFKEQQERKEIYLEYASEQAARTELLLQETNAFIEPDANELTAQYRQIDIVKNVDIQSATKHFKLNLEFGPYTMSYTKSGRHLLIGGRRGHVAAFDWISKKLHCEMNVMETVADVQWLHVHTVFAIAQKDWVYIYNNQGTELHCVKSLYRVNRLDFLPYHFLLAAGNCDGYISWLDVSIGEIVGNFNAKLGNIRHLRHNPANGVLCIGDSRGVVSMWSPKMREPLAKLLCHQSSISSLTVDPKGMHLVTAGADRAIKVWDVRKLSGPLAKYYLNLAANQVEVSQRGVLAFAQGNHCEIYKSLLIGSKAKTPYLRQNCDGFIHGMNFCPYEDVLGISTASGFESLLVPGSGEANYDAYEDNPYQTRKQRRECEVQALLEKIPAELITLDPTDIAAVDVPTLQEKIDAKRAVFFLKPPQIEISTRHKMKGEGGRSKAARNKQIVKDQKRKEFIASVRQTKQELIAEIKATEIPTKARKWNALSRFYPIK